MCYNTLYNNQINAHALIGQSAVKMSKKCQMFVYSGHALSYTKLVHRHATETEGNKYFK